MAGIPQGCRFSPDSAVKRNRKVLDNDEDPEPGPLRSTFLLAIFGFNRGNPGCSEISHPHGGRLPTYSSSELRNSGKRTAQHYKESLVIIGAAL